MSPDLSDGIPDLPSTDLPEAGDAAVPGGDTGAGMSPGAGGVADPGATADAQPPAPVYTAVEDWVIDYFLPMFRRTLGGEFRWCAQWWRHGEAISRLTALWHAWEVMRLQPGTGIATWYRDHLDHQLPILMGARGPFYQCSETAHREPHEAIAMPTPGEWWDGSDDTESAVPGEVPLPVSGPGLDFGPGDESA